MNKQSMVAEFMLSTGRQRVPPKPEIPNASSRMLRCELILEELQEFCKASGIYLIDGELVDSNGYLSDLPKYPELKPSMIDLADAIADLLYVVYGAAVAWGIRIDPVFGAVHAANMEKFGPGGYERADGKWMKPPNWKPPDIRAVLIAQGWEEDEKSG